MCKVIDPAPPPDAKRLLQNALGLFPTGVAVVTSAAQGELLGATVSSFTPVSLEPPLVLFSIARSANAFAAWESVETFSVNVLDEMQSGLSSEFARTMSDKWSGLVPRMSEMTGDPLLPDALAWFECRTWARYDGGDHLILVGEVVSYAHRSADGARPLVFFGGDYVRLEGKGRPGELNESFSKARE